MADALTLWLNERRVRTIEVVEGFVHRITAPPIHREVDVFGGLYTVPEITERPLMAGLAAPPVLQSQDTALYVQPVQVISTANQQLQQSYGEIYMNLRAPKINESTTGGDC